MELETNTTDLFENAEKKNKKKKKKCIDKDTFDIPRIFICVLCVCVFREKIKVYSLTHHSHASFHYISTKNRESNNCETIFDTKVY